MRLEFHDPKTLDADTEEQAIALTAKVFPGVEGLAGAYYYDSPPDLLLTAWQGDQLIGIRPVVYRSLELEGRQRSVAGGIIPAVLEEHRGQGHARQMVEALLQRLRSQGVELSLAFGFDAAPWEFLRPWGYRPLRASFVYQDLKTGQLLDEEQPCYALELGENGVFESMERAERLHLGRGTF